MWGLITYHLISTAPSSKSVLNLRPTPDDHNLIATFVMISPNPQLTKRFKQLWQQLTLLDVENSFEKWPEKVLHSQQENGIFEVPV